MTKTIRVETIGAKQTAQYSARLLHPVLIYTSCIRQIFYSALPSRHYIGTIGMAALLQENVHLAIVLYIIHIPDLISLRLHVFNWIAMLSLRLITDFDHVASFSLELKEIKTSYCGDTYDHPEKSSRSSIIFCTCSSYVWIECYYRQNRHFDQY